MTLVTLLVVSMAGCGVQLDAAPGPIPSGAIPAVTATTSGTAAPTGSPARAVRVWFAQEDGLVPVTTDLSRAPTVDPETVVDVLAAGPTAEQAEAGLRTLVADPLTDAPLAKVAVDTPVTDTGSVIVVLSAEAGSLPPGEQVLLLGQLVLSMTGAGYSSVTFVDAAGAPAAVPLPGGRLLDRPAVARDYAGLIIEL
jgi:hypothetical protein